MNSDSAGNEQPSAAAAGTFRLGDLTVNRLGFGAMRLTGTAPFHNGSPRDRAGSIRVLRRAVELGVNHIDTAAFYFSPLRSANELINSALAPYPDDLVLVTKVGPWRDPDGHWVRFAEPEKLRGQVQENLRQLGRDHLDVVNLRVSGAEDITGHVQALDALRAEGLLRHIGVSNVEPHHLEQALAVSPVACVQNPYGLGLRTEASAELLKICGAGGIAFVPFYAVAGEAKDQGQLAAADARSEAVARARGASPAQVALAWALHQGPHVLAIPGTGDPSHLEENVAAARLRLTEAELRQLDGE